MTGYEERKQVITLLNDSIEAGARQTKACDVLGLSERTLQRWQTDQTVSCDQRSLRNYRPPQKLTEIERAQVLTIANSDEFGHLPPSQIVPRLADQGRYIADLNSRNTNLKKAAERAAMNTPIQGTAHGCYVRRGRGHAGHVVDAWGK